MSNTNDQKLAELCARLARQQEQQQREEVERRLADERLRAGAEAEQELLRQIAAEEERERQDAEVWKLAEELEVLRRAEAERAEEVRRVQLSSGGAGGTAVSPMRVDDQLEEGEGETKEKKKGKGKEGVAWEIVGGSRRCNACRKEDTECRIQLAAIEKWREDIKAGKKFSKAPTGTSCKRCVSIRRKTCLLPATTECQEKLSGTKAKVAPSASSGGKRLWTVMEVDLPPRKKRREKLEEGMSEGEFRAAVMDILERIEGWLRQLAAELGNVLLQRLVSAREGGVAVGGEVPLEGGLETESDAGDSEYGTDKSEEGTKNN